MDVEPHSDPIQLTQGEAAEPLQPRPTQQSAFLFLPAFSKILILVLSSAQYRYKMANALDRSLDEILADRKQVGTPESPVIAH